MNYKYNVEVLELKEVHEMPGAWMPKDFRKLLQQIDYSDIDSIPENELREMTAMALSDLEPEDAADALLEYRFGEKLNKGQRNNLSEELKDDRLWEEYAKIEFHEELFNVGCMLFWAFPKEFPEPDMVKFKLKITALNPMSVGNLMSLKASFIARLLALGLGTRNTIFRLFDEDIASNSFQQSEDIIWKFEETGFLDSDQSNEVTVYTSWNWVDELKEISRFESNGYSDGQAE